MTTINFAAGTAHEATCGKGWTDRCRVATGPVCRCQCGGKNHGVDAGTGAHSKQSSLFDTPSIPMIKPAQAGEPQALKAEFSVLYSDNRTIVIVDENGPRSVTNDAEAVVVKLQPREGQRVLYLDSDRNFDELVVKDGRFVGFKSVLPRAVLRAIAGRVND